MGYSVSKIIQIMSLRSWSVITVTTVTYTQKPLSLTGRDPRCRFTCIKCRLTQPFKLYWDNKSSRHGYWQTQSQVKSLTWLQPVSISSSRRTRNQTSNWSKSPRNPKLLSHLHQLHPLTKIKPRPKIRPTNPLNKNRRKIHHKPRLNLMFKMKILDSLLNLVLTNQ